jgi:hypothetical protein
MPSKMIRDALLAKAKQWEREARHIDKQIARCQPGGDLAGYFAPHNPDALREKARRYLPVAPEGT